MVVTITDHEPVALVVDLTCVRLDIVGDLGLQGGGEHPPGPVPDDLIEQRPAGTGHHLAAVLVFAAVVVVVYYRERGRTFPTALPRWS
ncbi:hypothetical protein GCM10023353_15770 [Tomitella cavernea]|uniref:Uncharacterized protein n=1 Tax=Tomitella cavernea TaxID=1387982 RepID=A0ABP9CJ66_9ACTN